MKKENREWLYSLGIIVVLLLSIVGYRYKESPEYILNQYIQRVEQKAYKEACELFYWRKQTAVLNSESITQYMEEYFSENGFRTMTNKKELKEEKDFASYEVYYEFKDKSFLSTLSLIKENEKWQIIFPFKIETVKIEVPTGGAIIMEGKRIVPTKQEGYIELKLLPDHYDIRVEYPDEVQEDYFTTLNVPYEKEIKSPYKMYDVEVIAPQGTVVELAGYQQKVEGESVSFKHIVEGEYEIKVLDEGNIFKATSENIVIKEGNNIFKIDNMNVSQKGYQEISKFINQFYNDYKQGILEKESDFFEKYGGAEALEEARGDYVDWFIANKEVSQVDVKISVEQVKIHETGEASMEILEVVQLTNKEGNQFVDYQVVLKWNNIMSLLGGEYTFKERKLIESLVSYKDNEGNWVQY